LRSPLTALTLQSRNLAVQEMSPEAQQKLAQFEAGLQRANVLVDQLLSMARVQLNGPNGSLAAPNTLQQVSLQQLLRSVLEELMPLADAHGCEVGLEPGPDVVVTAGRDDLGMLLRNLIDNAIRYSGNGNEGSVVSVAFACDGNMAQIRVQDNGPGIPEQERQRVFDPFYRVLGTGQSGSGLGLSIVKNIVTNLRGEVDLAAPPDGQGTVVTVRFPV
jgi:two-component system OmpR family sensor kinase